MQEVSGSIPLGSTKFPSFLIEIFEATFMRSG